jgi:hypothetical protein
MVMELWGGVSASRAVRSNRIDRRCAKGRRGLVATAEEQRRAERSVVGRCQIHSPFRECGFSSTVHAARSPLPPSLRAQWPPLPLMAAAAAVCSAGALWPSRGNPLSRERGREGLHTAKRRSKRKNTNTGQETCSKCKRSQMRRENADVLIG